MSSKEYNLDNNGRVPFFVSEYYTLGPGAKFSGKLFLIA